MRQRQNSSAIGNGNWRSGSRGVRRGPIPDWCSRVRTAKRSIRRRSRKGSSSAATAAKLPIIPFHCVRHTHATLALKAGVAAKIVQERLGHANNSITLDLYAHVVPGMQRDAAETVAALLLD